MVPGTIIPLLAADAQRIVRRYLGSAAPGQKTPKIEPDFVAALVIGAMPDIALVWAAHLNLIGIDLKLQAVFCHGHPQVTFSPSGQHNYSTKVLGSQTVGQCELADLLLVIDDTTGDPNGDIILSRRASLVQAKMLNSGAVQLSLSGNEFAQLDLMQHWPRFKFESPGYGPRTRDFVTGYASTVPISGGSYGVIDKFQSLPNWEHDTPILPIRAGVQSFGEFFAGMTDTGVAATGRDATAGGSDDWSYTIDELLTVTGVKFLNLASIMANPIPKRGVSHMAFYQSATTESQPGVLGVTVNSGFVDGELPPGDTEVGDREVGISTVRVVLSRRPE